MLCYFVPVIGAILADSFLGRYRTICYFGVVYTAGNIIMCLAATPLITVPPVVLAMLGLAIIAVGTGGIKPCVAAFGGDQFHLPQQEASLQQFFSIFYFTINFGGFMGMVLTPILRKEVMCFGDDTCYALGFGFPAALMITALVLFLAGKPLYKIKSPKVNIILQFTKCSYYALVQKCRARDKNKDHWLDYARDKYDDKLIADMKLVLAMLFLLIPLPLFWSLFDQQGSRWTFQASRMNGELLGMQLLPDQMQVVNPAIVLLLIPLFDKLLYPLMHQVQLMSSLLQKMVTGGFFAGCAFVVSGMLELKLQETYPALPEKYEAHLNFINTLPCQVEVLNPFTQVELINASDMFMFRHIPAHNVTTYNVQIFTPLYCGDVPVTNPFLDLSVMAKEYQVDNIVISLMGSTLQALITAPEHLKKSLSGKPKARVVFLRENKVFRNLTVEILKHYNKGTAEVYSVPRQIMSTSLYVELDPGSYQYSVLIDGMLIDDVREMSLEQGGVYTLIIQEEDAHITFSRLFVMTTPNRVHMLWLIPQYLLISIAEVMFAISGLEFYCTQAPSSMKTVSTAAWYLSVAVGNLLVIIITQACLFKSQADEFFLFAALIAIDMIVFMFMAAGYTFVSLEADPSSSIFQDEGVPLLQDNSGTKTK